ncbi:hypothetical protein L345_13501, partial [Ophiophagus hannah]
MVKPKKSSRKTLEKSRGALQAMTATLVPTADDGEVTESPSSVSLTEWVDNMHRVWEKVRVALRKVAEAQKVQADKKRSPQTPFQVGEKVYLSTKYWIAQLHDEGPPELKDADEFAQLLRT